MSCEGEDNILRAPNGKRILAMSDVCVLLLLVLFLPSRPLQYKRMTVAFSASLHRSWETQWVEYYFFSSQPSAVVWLVLVYRLV
jgi:hypothetical protein